MYVANALQGHAGSSMQCFNIAEKKKHRTPVEAMMSPGTMKDIPQAEDTKAPAMSEPRMFPTEVFQTVAPGFHVTPFRSDVTTKQEAASIKTEQIIDSPHSVAALKTCHLPQSSAGGQLPG
ncbi:hypothetical protein F7725_006535, partial [Dissostichus mawsoni]